MRLKSSMWNAALLTAMMFSGAALAQPAAPSSPTTGAPAPIPMALTSSSFVDGGVIPDKFTQASGAAVSPALAWTNAPAGTQSFALVMHDPDTAARKGLTDTLHWLAFNIPATSATLPEGVPNTAQLPDGTVQIANTSGKTGFMGPGARGNVYHHYTLELFALDSKLALGPTASRADVMAAIDGHILGKAVLEGRFHR
jgi:Raf kinase inhibitor-like YbhB/YbcL family protein